MHSHATGRPMELDDLTATQMAELQRQFDDGDRASFDQHVESYGLDRATGDGIWGWFAQGHTTVPFEPTR